MADWHGSGSKPPDRRPSLKGRLMVDVSNGKIRIRSWPRKRGKAKTKAEQHKRDKFRAAQFASKYFPPQVMTDIVKATQNTPLLPRDITTMMLYNRIYAFIMPNGKINYPMPVRNEVSASLDAISQAEGDTLVRTAHGWRGQPGGGGGGSALVFTALGMDQDHPSHIGGWNTMPMDAIRHDAQGWVDIPNRKITPDLPGWYIMGVRARTANAGVWATGIFKNGALEQEASSDLSSRQTGMSGVGFLYIDGLTDYCWPAAYINTNETYETNGRDNFMFLIGPFA